MDKKNFRHNGLVLLAVLLFLSNCNNVKKDELNGVYYEKKLEDKYILKINGNYIEQHILTQIKTEDNQHNIIMRDTLIENKCKFFIDGNKLVFDGWYINEKNSSPTLCVGCPLLYENNTLVFYDNSNGDKKYVFYKSK